MNNKKILILFTALIVLLGFVSFVIFKQIDKTNIRLREKRKVELSKKLSEISNLDNNVFQRAYVNVYFDLAKINLKEKNFDEAISLYEQGLQIDAWRPDKIFELASAYKAKGRFEDAKERFDQVLGLKPSLFLFLRTKWQLTTLKKYKFEQAEQRLEIQEGKLKDLIIYILPFKVADIDMLEDLRVLLQDRFKFRFSILKSLPESAEGFDKNRNQYFVDELFKYVNKEYESVFFIPDTQAIMIVTSYDITEQGLNFIFGRTDPEMRLGIVSFNRFLADNPNKEVLFKRLFTQCLSTGGFLLGLPRCSFPGCARSYPHSFQEFKRKSYNLCQECQKNLNKLLEKIKNYQEVGWTKVDLERLQAVKNKYNL